MKSFQILLGTSLMNLCLVANLHAQSFQNKADIVERVYESLENKDKSTLTA